jgi:GT2 family glycosyltransferase
VERAETNRENAGVTVSTLTASDSPGAPICSIVVPSYNGSHLLARCLASILRHRPVNPGMPTEVVVVDNGSSDDTNFMVIRDFPEARLIRLEQNGDFCGAANAGLAAARGRYIELLNNDTEVASGWLEAGLAPFCDPTVGAVAPLVLLRSDPTRVDSAGDSYSLFGWATKRGHGQPAHRWLGLADDEVFGASGSSAFYRADALRRTGGFDSLLRSYYEDTDLAFRLRWAGYRCVFTARSIVYHDVSATYDHRSTALQRRMARNAETVFWANLPAALLAAAFLPHLGFLAVQALWRLANGRLGPFLLGKWDALRAWSEIKARRRRRLELARSAAARPHFALRAGFAADVRNHLLRPKEKSDWGRHHAR